MCLYLRSFSSPSLWSMRNLNRARSFSSYAAPQCISKSLNPPQSAYTNIYCWCFCLVSIHHHEINIKTNSHDKAETFYIIARSWAFNLLQNNAILWFKNLEDDQKKKQTWIFDVLIEIPSSFFFFNSAAICFHNKRPVTWHTHFSPFLHMACWGKPRWTPNLLIHKRNYGVTMNTKRRRGEACCWLWSEEQRHRVIWLLARFQLPELKIAAEFRTSFTPWVSRRCRVKPSRSARRDDPDWRGVVLRHRGRTVSALDYLWLKGLEQRNMLTCFSAEFI